MKEEQETKKEELVDQAKEKVITEKILNNKGFIPSFILRRKPKLEYINKNLGYN